MRENFDKKLGKLNCEMLTMANLVEQIIAMSVKSLSERDIELATQTMALDKKINETEREIERICLTLLLQYQPVFANDLRRVSSALKMVTDLERIGDQAADIAEITKILISSNIQCELGCIPQMARESAGMVSLSIDAYINQNQNLAQSVIKSDDTIDDLFIQEKQELIKSISNNKECGEAAIDKLMIAKYFERIGDHAVNIAEWVVFSITGQHKDAVIF